MSEEAARAAFKEAYNGQRNLMTPVAIRYGRVERLYYELSRSNIDHDFMNGCVGVTVLDMDGHKLHSLNRLCNSESEANSYVQRLPALAEEHAERRLKEWLGGWRQTLGDSE